MFLGNYYIVIYFLFMIKHDHLIKLNLWYEPLFTFELIAPYFIDVMSWALRYEFVYVIMIYLWYVRQDIHANRVMLVFVYIISEL